jgi:hypothetical protein
MGRPVELAAVDQQPADDGAVAGQELGRRVEDEVGAMVERLHQPRRREGRIDQQRQAVVVGQRRDGRDVEHVEAGIAERLAEQQPRLRPDRGAPAVDVAGLHEGRRDAEARQRVVQQVVRAAVQRARADDVRAGAGQRADREVQRGLAARRRDRADAAFERRDALLEDRVGRVRDPAVDVPERSMLNSDAACSLFSNTNEVVRWIGTARAPVAGSGAAPACTASVSKPGSDEPGMGTPWTAGRARGGVARPHCGLYWFCIHLEERTMKVSDILRVKGGTLFTVAPEQQLADAVNVMSSHDIGSLVVMAHGELAGMLTFREVIQAVVKNGGALGDAKVASVMDDHPLTCTPEPRSTRSAA